MSRFLLRELEQIHANPPINWYCARYQPVWVEFHVPMKGSHFTLHICSVHCFGFSGLLACSHAGFAQAGLSFALKIERVSNNAYRNIAKLGRFSVLWLSEYGIRKHRNLKLGVNIWVTARPYMPKSRLGSDLLLKNALWTTWTTYYQDY